MKMVDFLLKTIDNSHFLKKKTVYTRLHNGPELSFEEKCTEAKAVREQTRHGLMEQKWGVSVTGF